MRYAITGHDVSIVLNEGDAANAHVTGVTTGLRKRTVQPVRLVVKSGGRSGVHRIEVTGPTVRANGSVGGAYFTVLVGMGPTTRTDRYPTAPEWLRTIVEEVRPS